MENAYAEVVHWQNNSFKVRFGKAGKGFVEGMSRLIRAYAEGSVLEAIALKACNVMSIVLLQKHFHRSKPKDHSACLERSLIRWKKKDIVDCERRALTPR